MISRAHASTLTIWLRSSGGPEDGDSPAGIGRHSDPFGGRRAFVTAFTVIRENGEAGARVARGAMIIALPRGHDRTRAGREGRAG